MDLFVDDDLNDDYEASMLFVMDGIDEHDIIQNRPVQELWLIAGCLSWSLCSCEEIFANSVDRELQGFANIEITSMPNLLII